METVTARPFALSFPALCVLFGYTGCQPTDFWREFESSYSTATTILPLPPPPWKTGRCDLSCLFFRTATTHRVNKRNLWQHSEEDTSLSNRHWRQASQELRMRRGDVCCRGQQHGGAAALPFFRTPGQALNSRDTAVAPIFFLPDSPPVTEFLFPWL